MLVVKTGMSQENAVAERYAAADVAKLTGVMTVADLQSAAPADCGGIVSFGLCGGLGPATEVGQCFIYDACVGPSGEIAADIAWRRRLFAATRCYEARVWSSGEFNTADTTAQRALLFKQTGCLVIDDETLAVAQFAAARGIPWIGLRVVSDGAEDNLPPAVVDALNPDGTDNLEAVIASVASDPLQIPALIRTALEFEKSMKYLAVAAEQAGPHFQWEQRT